MPLGFAAKNRNFMNKRRRKGSFQKTRDKVEKREEELQIWPYEELIIE